VSSGRRDEDELPRSLAETWRAWPHDAVSIQRAYLRFQRRTRPEFFRAKPMVLRWVLLGIAIGMGSVYAATGAVRWLEKPARQSPAATHGARWEAAPRPPKFEEPQPKPRPEAVERAEPNEPPSGASVVSQSRGPTTPPSAPAASSSPSEQWQRAARGLRERDFQTAQEALAELSRASSGAERESALLVQAQLLFVQGREAEGVAMLRSLRATAKSLSVQQKAAELLARHVDLPSRRSFDAAEGTKQP
jgi:hypothetical protein